jgi:hypothetical protein
MTARPTSSRVQRRCCAPGSVSLHDVWSLRCLGRTDVAPAPSLRDGQEGEGLSAAPGEAGRLAERESGDSRWPQGNDGSPVVDSWRRGCGACGASADLSVVMLVAWTGLGAEEALSSAVSRRPLQEGPSMICHTSHPEAASHARRRFMNIIGTSCVGFARCK